MNDKLEKIVKAIVEHAEKFSTPEARMSEDFLVSCENNGKMKRDLTHKEILEVNEEVFKRTDGTYGSLARMAQKAREGK